MQRQSPWADIADPGFTLQTPISSFISAEFIYIIRSPYSIGDRIQIDDFKGDVIEINYFEYSIWNLDENTSPMTCRAVG